MKNYLQLQAFVVEIDKEYRLFLIATFTYICSMLLVQYQVVGGYNMLRLMGLHSIGLRPFTTVLYTLMEIPCSLRISLMITIR